MGRDVSLVCMRGGYQTTLVEPEIAKHKAIEKYIKTNMKKLKLDYCKFKLCTSLNDVEWQSAKLVIECIPEVLKLKQDLFATLQSHIISPTTILCSNSSSFPISSITQQCSQAVKEKSLNLHFFMPAHLVPCVEVVRGKDTIMPVVEESFSLMEACGMVPIRVNKEVEGFLGNRLQHALMREAFSLIDAGVATAEDIDKVVQYGFGEFCIISYFLY